jgi:bifunctional DNA-binding transcriptional regulator/antitoxin component of YhaV-PrlF toxin-antitoxin module
VILARLIFYPTNWVNVVPVTETTYYKDKVYLPKEVQEKLGLIDGDVLHIEVVEKGVAKLSLAKGCRTAKVALEKLDNPPDLGKVKGKLSREEIYEDTS